MKKILVSSIVLILVLSLVACSPDQLLKGSIKAGSWDGANFTNDWSNIKFTLPEGFKTLSASEINAMFAVGEEIMVNDESDKAAYDVATMKTLYDFVLMSSDGVSSIVLYYENLSFTVGTKDLGAEGYWDILEDQLSDASTGSELAYEFLTPGSSKIAGETYFVVKCSINGGVFSQDYYIRRLGNVMVVFLVSYEPASAAEISGFLGSITAA